MAKYKPNLLKTIPKRIKAHKKAVIITSASLLMIILIVVGILVSNMAWNNYGTNYAKSFNNAKTDIDGVILQATSKTSSNLTDDINDIIQIQSKLKADTKSYCSVGMLIKWQSFAKQYSNKINGCQQQKTRLENLLTSLSDVATYLTADQGLSAIISVANTKTNQNNQADKWSLVEAFWRQAAIDAAKLTDINQFKSIKTLAVSDFTKVADTWKQLSLANDAKNRQQFEDARTNLSQTYALLVVIGDNSKIQVDNLLIALNSSYKKAF